MRIEKIEITNLASFVGHQVMDFSQGVLRHADLMAVVADREADKAALVSCICMTLYNQPAPIGTGCIAPAELLGPKNGKGNCKITFSVPSGELYCAEWHVGRADGHDPELISSHSLRMIDPKGRAWQGAEALEKTAQAVGLSFRQFSTAFFLSQQRFFQFIDAPDAEKVKILEDLTGTEGYGEISDRVKERRQQARQEYDALLNRLEGMSAHRLLNESTLRQKEDEYQLLGNKIRLAENELARTKGKLAWKERYDVAENQLGKRKTALAEAQKNFHGLMSQQAELERYDELLPFQHAYSIVGEKSARIRQLREQLNDFRERQRALQGQIDDAEKEFSSASTLLQQVVQEKENRQADLRKGHELVAENKSLKTMLVQQEHSLQAKQHLLDALQQELAQGTAERERLEHHRQQTNLMLNTMVMHRPLLERFEQVKYELSRIHENVLGIQEHQRKIEKENQSKAEFEQALRTLHEDAVKLEETLGTHQAQLNLHAMANEGMDAEAIQQNAISIHQKEGDIRVAQSLWNKICLEFDEIGALDSEIRQLESQLAQKGKEKQQQESVCAEGEKRCENAYQSYFLSQNMHIGELRAQLKEGAPCPVCGGTHHPFHSETEQALGELHLKLKSDYEEAEARLRQAREDLHALKNEIVSTEVLLNEKRKNKISAEKFLQGDREEWQRYVYLDGSFADASVTANRATRAQILALLLDNATREKDDSARSSREFLLHQGEINRINKDIQAVTLRQLQNAEQQHSIQAQVRACQALVERHEEAISTAKGKIAEITGKIEPLLSITGWKEDVIHSYDKLVALLDQMGQTWTTYNESLQADEQNLLLTERELAAQNRQVQRTQAEIQDVQAAIQALRDSLSKNDGELRQMFRDESPQAVECKSSDRVAQASQAQDEVHERLHQLQEQSRAWGIRIATLAQEQQCTEQELKEVQTALDTRMAQFNALHSPVQFAELERLFADGRDWSGLREKVQACHQALREAQRDYERAEQELVALRQSEHHIGEMENQPALESQCGRLTHQIEEDRRALADIHLVLDGHRRCLAEMAAEEDRKKELKEKLLRWEQLDQAMSGQDGTDFRTMVQSRVLATLVAHANRQLQVLAPRYALLAHADSLSLEWQDHDMMDVTRPMGALTRGERSLACMALAMGLSAWQSQDAGVDMLWIDDSFAQWDDRSLNELVGMLGRWPGVSGRVVCVLSQHPLMQERIAPQIRIEAGPDGQATVTQG
ncbi:MAG: hypothetical protein ILA34_05070 [Bacteroidaceae bacterium]|nr:hypothetical protein [Bacteroidaceae bacterium]